MVRLKVIMQLPGKEPICRFQFHYGAIKSKGILNYLFKIVQHFNSIMVRLKVNSVCLPIQ